MQQPVKGTSSANGEREGHLFLRDLADDDRALAGSYGISLVLATAFLVVVHTTELVPPMVKVETPDKPWVEWVEPGSIPLDRQSVGPAPTKSARGRSRNAADAPAFATLPGALVGPSVAEMLRKVDVTGEGRPLIGGAESGEKVDLRGEGGAKLPGRGGIGVGLEGPGGGRLGRVSSGARVGAASVLVDGPTVTAPPLSGPVRNTDELGAVARRNQAQLRDCYSRYGLSVNPELAGTVTISLVIAGDGAVARATVAASTWGGKPGAADAEACLVQRVRGWRFAASASEGTYSFPVNFTR